MKHLGRLLESPGEFLHSTVGLSSLEHRSHLFLGSVSGLCAFLEGLGLKTTGVQSKGFVEVGEMGEESLVDEPSSWPAGPQHVVPHYNRGPEQGFCGS